MPIHDWTRVDAGTFHAFHVSWITHLSEALNCGVLPPDYYALIVPPIAGAVTSSDIEIYAARANRILVKRRVGSSVAAIEVVSPGNKSSPRALRFFTERVAVGIRRGIHLLIIDLFPPTKRDPQGIHNEIWGTMFDQPFVPPENKALTAVSYLAAAQATAYVDTLAVGDPLPSSPLFLDADHYVPAPLESSYQNTWEKCPEIVRKLVKGK